MKPYLLTDLSNDLYHSSKGISNSGLSYIARDPAVYKWSKAAPVDDLKLVPLDFGKAVHSYLLEYDTFNDYYVVEPVINKLTNAGKEEVKQFKLDNKDKTIITSKDFKKITLMAHSALAHPTAHRLLTRPGQAEASIYWADDVTGELCKCRPDRMIHDEQIILDVKTTDDMTRFQRSMVDYRYHVQAAFYSMGYYEYYGVNPRFIFLVISKKIDCGRYPVRTFELDEESIEKGAALMRRDLDVYHQSMLSNEWDGIETIRLPEWAFNEAEIT